LTKRDEQLTAAIDREQGVAQLLARYGFFHTATDLHSAYCTMPENRNVEYWMSLKFAGAVPNHRAFCAEERINRFRDMVARHPDNALALNGLADALTQAGRLVEALPLARRAVDLDPDNGMILDTLGWILFLQGETEAALAILQESDKYLPNHPIVLYHLGAAQLAVGHTSVGRKTLQRSLSLSQDFPGADQARRLLAK
jgi:predicted Zn-dependent protease